MPAIRTAATAVTLAATLLCAAQPATAASRPNLKPTSINMSPGPAISGINVSVQVFVANRSRVAAPASTVRSWLSSDLRRDAGDVHVGDLPAPRLAPGKEVLVRDPGSVPASVGPGDYHLIACVDATRRVRETREDDDCRVRTATFTIVDLD